MTLTELPRNITIGDTVTWDEDLSDYLASASWVLTYSFTSPDAQFASTHVASGDTHQITIDTTDLEVGQYRYAKTVTDGSERFTLESGYINVEPDLAADTTGVDRRAYAEKALDAIEAVLAGKATQDQTSYSLNGRALSRYSPDELNAWRASLRIEVADLKAAVRIKSGGKSHRNVRVRFPSGSV